MNAEMVPKQDELDAMTNDQLLDGLEDAARKGCEMAGYSNIVEAYKKELKARLDAG